MADHAVLIGIESYPGMKDLKGPCNDAIAFESWLLDPEGGGLDGDKLSRCLSREFPLAADVAGAHPVVAEMETLFRPLVEKAALSQHTEGRLFIFAAGHGFADRQDMNSAALFAANANFFMPVHLALVEYARFFQRTWAFDEVILIMDACRTTNAMHQITPPPLPLVGPHANANKVKVFLGYGTGFNEKARERAVNSGDVRGIFTMALLDALRNASPNQLGRVNGTVVKKYIHNRIGEFAGDLQIAPPDIKIDDQKEVCFVERAQALSDVTFNLDPAHEGSDLVIAFGGVQEVHRWTVAGERAVVALSDGLYKARIDGTSTAQNFEVPNDAEVTL